MRGKGKGEGKGRGKEGETPAPFRKFLDPPLFVARSQTTAEESCIRTVEACSIAQPRINRTDRLTTITPFCAAFITLHEHVATELCRLIAERPKILLYGYCLRTRWRWALATR